jgi:hypothetical protein
LIGSFFLIGWGQCIGELLLANEAVAFGIRRRPYTKHIGPHTEKEILGVGVDVGVWVWVGMGVGVGVGVGVDRIPTLTTQAVVSGIRRRSYRRNIRSQQIMRLGGQSIGGAAPGHSRSGIWNPKATLYKTYWIPHGIWDSHPDQSGSCIWNPKATLYERYPIPEVI